MFSCLAFILFCHDITSADVVPSVRWILSWITFVARPPVSTRRDFKKRKKTSISLTVCTGSYYLNNNSLVCRSLLSSRAHFFVRKMHSFEQGWYLQISHCGGTDFPFLKFASCNRNNLVDMELARVTWITGVVLHLSSSLSVDVRNGFSNHSVRTGWYRSQVP